MVIGSAMRNIPLVEARDADGNPVETGADAPNIGMNGEPFYLVFAEDWWAKQPRLVA